MDVGGIGAYIAVGTPVVMVAVWLGRLEGLVRSQDKRHVEHEAARQALRRDIDAKHAELREDIQYIRERIDRALNGKH